MLGRRILPLVLCSGFLACQPKKKSDADVAFSVGAWWSDPGSNLLTAVRDGRAISLCLSGEGVKDNQKFLSDLVRFERTVRDAIQEWLSSLMITPSIESKKAPCRNDLKGGYVQVVLHYDEARFQSHIAQTTSPTLGVFLVGDGGLHLNVNGVLNPSRDPTGGYKTTLHELGHAMGLTHSQVAGAVMQPNLSRASSRLTRDDIEGIKTVWGRISQGKVLDKSVRQAGKESVLAEPVEFEEGQSKRVETVNVIPKNESVRVALRYDSWFKTSTAQSFSLPESAKCHLRIDQKIGVKILDEGQLYSGHLKVKLTEDIPVCVIGQSGAVGYLYKQHLD